VSSAGLLGNVGQANYGSAKAAIAALTVISSLELGRIGVRANAIAPVARTRMTEDLMGAAADKLDPNLITPVVAYLAHEECQVSGEIYSCGGGRVARVFVAVTPGYFKQDLSVEDVRDNWDQIRNEDGYVVPNNLPEELGLLMQHFKG
jgi:hypothetical protein